MTFTLRRVWILLVLAALVAGSGLAACGNGGAHGGASVSPDAVVARVNGSAIHQSAVDLARAEARFSGVADGAGEALDAAIERAIRKSDPLPKPEDPNAFHRELNITFKPFEE